MEPSLLEQEFLLKYDAPIGSQMKPSDIKIGSCKLEEILNSILPPKKFSKENVTYQQKVSPVKSGREDVIALEEKLNSVLKRRQARMKGICPVREDIYRQCFDEIIREVTTFSPERGLLLLRVRDEIRMTIDAYRTLFESRKQMQSEDGIEAMSNKITELTDRKAKLNLDVQELRNKLDITEKRINEERTLEQKTYQEEIDFLKHQISHFEQFLKTLETEK